MDDDECPAADGSFSTRFSASRLRQIADCQPTSKKDVICLCSFGSLLNINSFSVPADLLDWVVMKINPDKSLFSHRQKSILYTKDMVRKNFNVPSGSRAVELLRRNEPHVLREPYRVGSRAPTRRTIEVLEVANVLDVVTIKRAWVLLCIALVLSPGTGNMVPLEYLAILVDMDSINEFAWDEHFLVVALNKVKKYQKKRNEGKTAFWIGGCLPMFAIIYMDFVEVPRLLASEHRIDYSLPRSCFVCNDDFKLIQEIDRNKLSLDKIDFGKRNLRRLAETSCVRLDGCGETRHQNNKFVRTDAHIPDIPSNSTFDGCDFGGDVCGSLDEWLHPLPSSEEMEIPSHMIPVYEKHKKLHATEVKKVLKSFGQVLEAMFCKRLASILVEANATATRNNDHMPKDVTFHAPDGNAPDVDHTRAPIHTSPEAHKSPTPQEVDADKEVACCSNTNQNEAQRDIGLEKMQSCGFPGMEDVQQGPILGEREKSVGTEVGADVLKDPYVADEGQNVILSHGTMAALQGLALEFDDGPSMSLFKEGTEDFEWLNMDDDTTRKYKEANKGMETPIHVSAGPTYDKTPKHATQGNNTKLPGQNDGDGPCFDTEPKLPSPCASATRYKIPKTKHGKPIPDFIEIEGFHTSLENFHSSLKPRAEIDSDIMTLYLKTFNLEQMYNRKKPKKFEFSVFMGSQLAVDPGLFNPRSCEREFRRACENNQITKSDILFIVVVQNRHWGVVVANLMHKQFNVFDSIKNSEDVTLLTNATNNVITNIKKVANCESAFKFDLNCFEIITLDYPTQEIHYNCGFYAILYLENYNGVVMMHFDETYIPNLRKRIAANLLKHPSNNLDPAEQLRKLLEV
uniref:Ubiquitin-like protease family profile domain-containing protein n=1 Tax=Hordeum vulgare subsp. vulgare TaxID=112509 RepID=A0A8I7BBN5_HORVV